MSVRGPNNSRLRYQRPTTLPGLRAMRPSGGDQGVTRPSGITLAAPRSFSLRQEPVHDDLVGERRQIHAPVRDRRRRELRVEPGTVARRVQIAVPQLVCDVARGERPQDPGADEALRVAASDVTHELWN